MSTILDRISDIEAEVSMIDLIKLMVTKLTMFLCRWPEPKRTKLQLDIWVC